MAENSKDETFMIETDSPLIGVLQKLMLIGVKILAVLTAFLVFWGIFDVGVLIYRQVTAPPFLFIEIEKIMPLLGSVLAVMIAIEIFLNVILYLRQDISHIKLVIATALMAIARKVIIVDYEKADSSHFYALGALILALGIAYWFVKTKKDDPMVIKSKSQN